MTQLPPTSAYPQVPMFEEPPRKSRTSLWIGLGVVAVLVLCLGAVAVGAVIYTYNKDKATTTAAATPSTGTPAKTATVTLTVPDSIGSRSKNTDQKLNETVDNAKQSMGSGLAGSGAGEPVAAFYGSAEKKDLMMVFALPTPVSAGPMPDAQFDQMFSLMGTMFGGKAGLAQAVDPGSLGGKAKCADLQIQTTPLALCAWADAGCFGYVFWYFSTVEKVKGEFVTVRELIEHRT
jgi:hypothetical protein